MSREPDNAALVRWPADRFFWAVLDAPGWSRSGVLPLGLRAEFEDEVPVPPEELHAVCTPLGDGRVLACAARRGNLAALPAGTPSLVPSSLPPCVPDGAADDPGRVPRLCGALNLLVGPFEPAPLRRARLRRHLLAAASVGMCAALAAVGLSRRAAHWDAVADAAAGARAELIREVAPAAAHGPEPLLAELARRRAEHDAAARILPARDASQALASLLRGWPTDVPARTQSVIASGTSATVSVNVDGDPAPFLRALRAPEGWTKGEPRLNNSGGTTRIVLGLSAIEGASKAQERNP